MMILKKKEAKLSNEDTTTRRNPDSNSGIYLTSVKVAQCRPVAENRREMEEVTNVTSNKTATRKVHPQLTISEAFDRCINSMNNLYFSTTD